MSVLIKGMEMPKSCGFCPLRHEARDGDECYLGASLTEYQKRPDNCPLVHVPPHGRLIDADALEHDFREDADEEWNRFATPVNWSDAFDDVANIVADAPTIIPAEEGKT